MLSRDAYRKEGGFSHWRCLLRLRAWALDSGRHGFKSHLDHVLAEWPWKAPLHSLSLFAHLKNGDDYTFLEIIILLPSCRDKI